MAVRYDGTSDLFLTVNNGTRIHENSATANVYAGVDGFPLQQLSEVYRKVGGTWVRHLHTDKLGPNAAPTSVTITSILGGGGTRQARINWVEATGMPLPAGSYDLYIFYFNSTDPSKNQSTMLAAGRVGTTFTFPNAGFSGDAGCYAQLSYQEPGVGGFAGPVAETSHISL